MWPRRTLKKSVRRLRRPEARQTIHNIEAMLGRERRGREALLRRWVVERTFGWMIRWRRVMRDYERRIDASKAMIHTALGASGDLE